MNIEWKSKPVSTFEEISIGDCFCLPLDDEQNVYLKISPIEIRYDASDTKYEVSAINIQTGKSIGLESYEQVYPVKTTLMIER